MRAEKYTKFVFGCAIPCDDCGGKLSAWHEEPNPGHNLATLYECADCKMVISLADAEGDEYVKWLP